MIDRDDGMRVLCIVGCVWVRELPNTPTSDTFEPGIGHNRLRTPTDFCKLQTHCNGTSTISKITIKQTMILVILFICGRYVCRSLSLNSLSCQWFSTIRASVNLRFSLSFLNDSQKTMLEVQPGSHVPLPSCNPQLSLPHVTQQEGGCLRR